MTSFRFMLCILLGSVEITIGAKILAFVPVPANSHHAVYRPILRRLAEKGHEVTYYTPLPMNPPPPPNLKIVLIPSDGILSNSTNLVSGSLKGKNYWNTLMLIEKMGRLTLEKTISQDVIQDLMKSEEKFDLVMHSSSYGQYCLSTLGHKLPIPTVEVMPAGDPYWMLQTIGAPDNPSYVVTLFSHFSDQMTLWERMQNTIHWVMHRYAVYFVHMKAHQDIADRLLKYPGWEPRPSISEMVPTTALYLVNSHYSTGYLFPKPSHVKEIGGVNVLPGKPLPKHIQEFLDSAVDGAIYFSMGSVIRVSDVAGDSDVMKAFLDVFKKMKHKVVWKWESDSFPNQPSNVLTSKWFPQQDVLAHKNVKVFITQGGMMSIFEAISRGVPLLGIPIFGDQHKNMKHATTYGYGIELDFNNITAESLQWALGELLNNPSYKRQAEKRSRLFHDRPIPPIDEAVYWIEYVLRNGDALRPISTRLPFYSLYLLDVMGIFIAILILIYLLVSRFIKLLLSTFYKKKVKNKID